MGGLAIVVATLVGYACHQGQSIPGLLEGATAAALVGLVDDIYEFRPLPKLFWQTVAASVAVWLGLRAPLTGDAILDATATLVWLVWMCNAFNVMDMADGLAGGVGVIVCAALGVGDATGQFQIPGGLLLGCVGGLCGFLVYNLPPARIYMGDTGSLFLGFLFAGLSTQVVAVGSGLGGVVAPVLLLLGPNFEALFVACTRLVKCRSPIRPSNDHVVQRLVSYGLGLRVSVATMCVVVAIGAAAALAYPSLSGTGQWMLLAAVALICLGFWRQLLRIDVEGDGQDGRPSTVFSKNWLVLRITHQAVSRVAHEAKGLLVDLGCGQRPYEAVLDGRVSAYFGFDRTASSKVDVRTDLSSLPLKASSCDTVLCSQVLEHLPEPAYFVGETARVLRPGGSLLLTAPHIWGVHEEPHDYFRFTPYGLRHIAACAGLDVRVAEPLAGFWVTAGARLCYYLEHFEWGLMAPFVRLLYFLIQTAAFLLDLVHRVDSDAWNTLLVATKPDGRQFWATDRCPERGRLKRGHDLAS